MKRNRLWDWRRAEQGFFTLIGLLLVIVIIGILFSLYAGGPGPGGSARSGEGTTVLGGTKERANEVLCQNNLSQLRAAIATYAATAAMNPPSLGGLQAEVSLTCPVGGEPYQYDPGSGRVRCIHPGHESF